jgi:hypothetical protein
MAVHGAHLPLPLWAIVVSHIGASADLAALMQTCSAMNKEFRPALKALLKDEMARAKVQCKKLYRKCTVVEVGGWRKRTVRGGGVRKYMIARARRELKLQANAWRADEKRHMAVVADCMADACDYCCAQLRMSPASIDDFMEAF